MKCCNGNISYYSAYNSRGLIRTFGTTCLCTVWLGNRVETMEFSGGSKTREDITDSYSSDASLQHV